MSNVITNLCRGLVMSPAQKAVLMCLADRADDAGLAWPSVPGICAWTCLGRTAVISARLYLEQKGYMSADRAIGRTSKVAFNIPLLESLNQSASRTSPPAELVRETDYHQSASRTPPVRETDYHQSASRTPPVRETDYTSPPAGPNTSIHQRNISKTPRKSARATKTTLPTDFQISEQVKSWAKEKGHSNLSQRLEHFKGKALASGYQYANWDQAFMNAIRDDWAKLNQSTTRPPTSFDQLDYRKGIHEDGSILA